MDLVGFSTLNAEINECIPHPKSDLLLPVAIPGSKRVRGVRSSPKDRNTLEESFLAISCLIFNY